MKCYLTCPQRGTLVKLQFDRAATDGRILGVRACSGFEKEDWVDCDRECVTLLNERVESLIEQSRGHEIDPAKH